jgi:hypothetical protein
MRLFAAMFTTGVLLSSVIVVALVGFPASANGAPLIASPTPTIPETLQTRCAAQDPGVWLITDETDYPVGASVHVAVCNQLTVPVVTRLSDDPLAPLLHLEQRRNAAWLALFDVTVIFEDNVDVNQAATADPTKTTRLPMPSTVRIC